MQTFVGQSTQEVSYTWWVGLLLPISFQNLAFAVPLSPFALGIFLSELGGWLLWVPFKANHYNTILGVQILIFGMHMPIWDRSLLVGAGFLDFELFESAGASPAESYGVDRPTWAPYSSSEWAFPGPSNANLNTWIDRQLILSFSHGLHPQKPTTVTVTEKKNKNNWGHLGVGYLGSRVG